MNQEFGIKSIASSPAYDKSQSKFHRGGKQSCKRRNKKNRRRSNKRQRGGSASASASASASKSSSTGSTHFPKCETKTCRSIENQLYDYNYFDSKKKAVEETLDGYNIKKSHKPDRHTDANVNDDQIKNALNECVKEAYDLSKKKYYKLDINCFNEKIKEIKGGLSKSSEYNKQIQSKKNNTRKINKNYL
jgi:hypothetical protein